MISPISRLVLRYHRWLGLLAALPVIFWGLSGLSHPIMTRVQPQPAAMMPPAELLAVSADQRAELPALATLLPAQGIKAISEARLLQWQGRPVWQITVPGQAERQYVDARSGQSLPGLDAALAEYLARHYSGEKSRAITQVSLITAFSADYAYVNRLLPVWRVEFADGDHLRAFVETSPLRLATLDNGSKSLFSRWFRAAHSWSFISHEGWRDALMSLFLLLALCASVGGVWMYGFFRGKPESGERATARRRWHRRLGLTVALSSLVFTVSAMLHLLMLDKRETEAGPQSLPTAAIDPLLLLAAPAALKTPEGSSLQLLATPSGPVWRAAPASMAMVGRRAEKGMPEGAGEHAHHQHAGMAPAKPAALEWYFRVADGAPIVDGAQTHARQLALAFSGLPASAITSLEPVRKFEGEYGFINKRLPVWKVSFATEDERTLYVETTTGIKAAEVTASRRLEGWSFAYLHKWHWLDFLGKDGRDLLAGLFALLNVLVVVLGLYLWWCRRWRGQLR